MPTKSETKQKVAGNDVELISLPRSLCWMGRAEKRSLKALNRCFARKDAWVVDTTGDAFGHYLSLIGNLTGQIEATEDPMFCVLRATIKAGLPRSAFDRVKLAMAASAEQLSEVTEIPMRTVSRRERFKPDESDRILRVASAFQKAVELFEELDGARRWFTTPKDALAGLTPIECCDTDTGAAEVEDLLSRIADGVFS